MRIEVNTSTTAVGRNAAKPPTTPANRTEPTGTSATRESRSSEDKWEPSGMSPADLATRSKAPGSVAGFDLEAFKLETKRQLLEQVQKSKQELDKAGIRIRWSSDIPYQVDPEEKAAEVPEEWGADQTSQRIVDFALSMRQMGNAKDLTDEEFISQIRSAIEDGFRSAKSELKELPGPAAKLFNDTYEAAMKKLDQTLEDWKTAKEEPVQPPASDSPPAPASPMSKPSSGFSAIA
ncbi:MAG TPA: DUF5610 domain-containing protein [Fibrobacteria bacterium]|nr:DUF5610 domain-containing protein [Fibrobacteria bacterium]HOX51299.1 DUF5610 domain-containing protein [Fibrobacteria bacterium]